MNNVQYTLANDEFFYPDRKMHFFIEGRKSEGINYTYSESRARGLSVYKKIFF